jgi:ribonucleoside-diphosphate reductase beta chain
MYAWKKGLKTAYYLRSRLASKIAKTTRLYKCPVKQPRVPLPVRSKIPNPAKLANNSEGTCKPMLLDLGFNLTLRPMKYPVFFEKFKTAIKNTWTVEEINFSTDVTDLRARMKPAEQHLIKRLVTFFATGDSIVGNNPVLNLYKHVNSPEARMYLSRQLYEEAVHMQFYLTLLDTYITDPQERADALSAVETIPLSKRKRSFVSSGLTPLSGSQKSALTKKCGPSF